MDISGIIAKNLNRIRKKDDKPQCSAVIVAAGSSTRMGNDKIFLDLGGMPVIARTLKVFDECPAVKEIVVVSRQDSLERIADICVQYGISKISKVIAGGKTRSESALAGVSEVSRGAKLIAIHDGARPLVTEDVVFRTVYAARDYMSAVPVIPIVDTIKIVDDEHYIAGEADRNIIYRVQTPQVFDADLIRGALTHAVRKQVQVTDDCSAMEAMGVKTRTVEGSADNIKLTTPEDVMAAVEVLKRRGEL